MRSGIMPIVDVGPLVEPDRALDVTRALIAGGARMIQLRAKEVAARTFLDVARSLRAETRDRDALLIVNDRPDIALLAGADAVHLGQTDLPAAEVRRWLPANIELGISTHNLDQARLAASEGLASYIGYGPIYATPTKKNPDPIVGLEGLRAVRRELPSLEVVAIGGITLDRLPELRRAGATSAALISALLTGIRDTSEITTRMRRAIELFDSR